MTRYTKVFDIHYICEKCGREIKTCALKKPVCCPFCKYEKLKKLK